MIISGGGDGKLRIYQHIKDTEKLILIEEIDAHSNEILSIEKSQEDKYFASAGVNDTLIVWEVP